MKHFFKPRVSGLLLTLLLLAGGTQTAFATGTPSGVIITNQASVSYEVGLVPQATILSDDLVTGPGPTTFAVDNMVDLTVVSQDALTIPVAPGSIDRVLEFVVTNTGNTTQNYLLSVVNGAIAIPMGSVQIWLDTDTNGVYTAAGDTQYDPLLGTGDLDPNGGTDNMTVFIVAVTPLAAVDLTVDNYSLLAETADAGTVLATSDAAVNTAAGVEVLFVDIAGTALGDGVNDGTHSDTGTYTVASATLTVTKSAVVLDAFGTDFAIPGAIVTYTILVTNTGGTDATSVVISDVIPVNSTYVAGSITLNGGGQTDLSDSPFDESEFSGGSVIVTVPTLTATVGTATIIFQVMID